MTTETMIPVGYMAKRNLQKPKAFAMPNVRDIYSVSSCVNDNFDDYSEPWKHNGYWLFDSPELIQQICAEQSISLDGASLFFYEAYQYEYDESNWRRFEPDPSILTRIVLPESKNLEGFDVVTFYYGNAPECSPLSCNGLGDLLTTNSHCLFATLDEAKCALDAGEFSEAEPGPYRIFAIYSVEWP